MQCRVGGGCWRWLRLLLCSCVFSLELSFEGLAHFLPLGQPLDVVGMPGKASILHHCTICLMLPFGINDSL